MTSRGRLEILPATSFPLLGTPKGVDEWIEGIQRSGGGGHGRGSGGGSTRRHVHLATADFYPATGPQNHMPWALKGNGWANPDGLARFMTPEFLSGLRQGSACGLDAVAKGRRHQVAAFLRSSMTDKIRILVPLALFHAS